MAGKLVGWWWLVWWWLSVYVFACVLVSACVTDANWALLVLLKFNDLTTDLYHDCVLKDVAG